MNIEISSRAVLVPLLSLTLSLLAGCGTANQHSPQRGTTNMFFPISATTLDGQPFSIVSEEHQATVLIFLLPDCPIANGYSPEITRMHQAYKEKGIRFALVYSDRDITKEKAAKHRVDFGYSADGVIDPKLSLAKFAGAKVTPEAAVLSPNGVVLYRGRIDDRFPAYGKQRAKPTKTELRDALDAVLAGNPIAVARTKAVGCFLDVE